MFTYFLQFKDPDFEFNIHHDTTMLEDLEDIIKMEHSITDKMHDFSNSYNYASRYNSIDVTKKNIYSEIDDYADKDTHKDKAMNSQMINEDVVESFENDLEVYIRNDDLYSMLNKLKFYIKDSKNNRFCSFCLHKKTDRAHHCRQCKKCLRKMDHHCMFLYTCIGYGNYKFFILTLLYACLILGFICYTMIDGLKFYINEYGDNFYLSIFCGVYLFILLLSAFLTYFFYLHLRLLCYNVTTIDHVEKEKEDISKIKNNIFNMGIYKNISSVMGMFILWLFPIGYGFDVNKELYDKMKEQNTKERDTIRRRLNSNYNLNH